MNELNGNMKELQDGRLSLVLTADSGSTKTAWLVADKDGKEYSRFTTGGLNPLVMGEDVFRQHLEDELLPNISGLDISTVRFFGAGCTKAMIPVVIAVFAELLPEAKDIVVDSDMLGAAISLCGDKEGIAAILGTGANSCLYDGSKIVKQTPALGFILGDEGSGAVLGKRFLNGILKGTLPQDLRDQYLEESGLDVTDIINKVYRQPAPNRFLASCSLFIAKHLDVEPLRQLVIDNFRNFLKVNIKPYGRDDLPVNIVGSVAYVYEAELRIAAEKEGVKIGVLKKNII